MVDLVAHKQGGSGNDYCGDGCQARFGTCDSSDGPASPGNSPNQGRAAQAGAANPPSSAGCTSVSGLGQFATHTIYDFSSATALPSGLVAKPENDDVETGKYSRTYVPSLVTVSGGYVNLRVPGGQNTAPIRGAMFQTEDDILYASVRTTAILTEEKGVCNGLFFYSPGGQEIDIEFLSDPASQSNTGANDNSPGGTSLFFTNHESKASGNKKFSTAAIPNDATSQPHEYRIDWTEGVTAFYVDGQQVGKLTQYVPSEPGPWIWNNWANGDLGWSMGPPGEDATLKISKIEMYYNTKSSKC